MTKERKIALDRAAELEIEFTNNISTKNLKILIKAKEDELANDLNPTQEETPKPEAKGTVELKTEVKESKPETKPEVKEETPTPEETTYADEMEIQRISACGNYKAKIIGAKEAARRSNLTEEEVLTAIESNEPVKGWTFREVE